MSHAKILELMIPKNQYCMLQIPLQCKDSNYFSNKDVTLTIHYFALSLLACHLLFEDCFLRVSKLAGCCMGILIEYDLFEQTYYSYFLHGPWLKLNNYNLTFPGISNLW